MRSIRIAVAGLIALAVAMGIGRFAFTPLLPIMQDDVGLSVAAGGWLASANYFGYLVGALSAVWMRLRAAHVIRVGLVLIGVTTLAMGVTDEFVAWLILRALAGAMSAWVLVFASAWCLEQLAALQRPSLSGVVFGGVGVGIAATGALCIALMHASVGSAQAWIVFGAFALALSAVVWPVFGTDRAAASGSTRRAAGGRFHWDGESIRLVLCYGAFGFGYIIPATFLPLMAKQAISDPAIFGWCWPVFGATALVSTLGAAVLQKFISDRRLWVVSHLVMAVGVALPVLWSDIGGILLAALFVGGTFMVIVMVGLREARKVAGVHATGLIAAMTAAFAIGQVAGPLSVSLLAREDGNLTMALLVASAVLVISAYALARPRARTPPPAKICGDVQ